MTMTLAAFLGFLGGVASSYFLYRFSHWMGNRVDAMFQASPLQEVISDPAERVSMRAPTRRTMRD